ncbi:MAG: GNAT family N-acetyltransferase [Ignavibacteria bacterium]|nr:GNAT family N-acetyltransferase [Ignavibacteria bacterium]
MMEPPVVSEASGVIRPLAASDRQPILDLLRGTGVFSSDEIDIALELIDIVLTNPDQKDYIIYSHEESGVVDGYYCIGPTPATDGTFDLYWIAVGVSAQGKGVGRQLNRHAEQQIVERDGKLIIVETSSREAYEGTRRFYAKQQYQELARIRDYYKTGDDLVVYGKYVNQTSKGG